MSIQNLDERLYFYNFFGIYATYIAIFLIKKLEIWLEVTPMEDVTSPKAILERLKQGTGSKTDKDLAVKLGVAQQSVYNVNAKNRVPDGWIRKVAAQYNLSTDWLYYGEGNMYRGTGSGEVSPVSEKNINRQVLLEVVEVMEESLRAAKKNLPSKAKAELIYQLYQIVTEGEADGLQPVRMFKLIQGAMAAHE